LFYKQSVATGASNLLGQVRAIHDHCGNDFPTLAVGFSQGAHVIQSALDQTTVSNTAQGLLSGAALFASPRFSDTDPDARGTFPATAGAAGLAGPAKIAARFSSTVRTWCVTADPVCTGQGHSYSAHTGSSYGCDGADDPMCLTKTSNPILEDAAGLLAADVLGTQRVAAVPTGEVSALYLKSTARARMSAAAIYAQGAPSTSFSWDFNHDGTVDQVTTTPWTSLPISNTDALRLARGGTIRVSTDIAFIDGSHHVYLTCIRRSGQVPC
jgi:hypothetical protein